MMPVRPLLLLIFMVAMVAVAIQPMGILLRLPDMGNRLAVMTLVLFWLTHINRAPVNLGPGFDIRVVSKDSACDSAHDASDHGTLGSFPIL